MSDQNQKDVFRDGELEISVVINKSDTERTTRAQRAKKGRKLQQYLLNNLQVGIGWVEMEFPNKKAVLAAANAAYQMSKPSHRQRMIARSCVLPLDQRMHTSMNATQKQNGIECVDAPYKIRFWIDYREKGRVIE